MGDEGIKFIGSYDLTGDHADIDLKPLCSDYAKLTVDSFYIVINNIHIFYEPGNTNSLNKTTEVIKIYDNTSGILHLSGGIYDVREGTASPGKSDLGVRMGLNFNLYYSD